MNRNIVELLPETDGGVVLTFSTREVNTGIIIYKHVIHRCG
jgi:hypothetical protein